MQFINLSNYKMRFTLFSCLFLLNIFVNVLSAQNITTKNGWKLPPYGNINVLMIYAEVEFDVKSNRDPFPNGNKWWKPGSFPTWKAELIDSTQGTNEGLITTFFRDMSFGMYNVRAINYPQLVKVKSSSIRSLHSMSECYKAVIKTINNQPIRFEEKTINELDQWDFSGPAGAKRTNIKNGAYDMVMILYRNAPAYRNGTGHVRKGSIGVIDGRKSDSYSVFGAGDGIPFNIMKHEYSHMLFGGNNFHCGGGQHAGGGPNHFIPFQGGWSMLGGYNSSFRLGNAWDRDRLGWKPSWKEHTISALDLNGNEIRTDFKASDSLSEKIVILRDFVSTGDAVQIKLPYLKTDEYSQYIWLENHQGSGKNNNELDRYQFDHYDCIPNTKSGIYAYLQVGHDKKEGEDIFKGYADYLRHIPADGFYDIKFSDTLIQNIWCVNDKWYYPFIKRKSNENPLTGTGDQEEVAYDLNRDGKIGKKEGRRLVIENKLGNNVFQLPTLGHRRHAFSSGQNNTIGIGTNPSTASMKTLTSFIAPIRDAKNNQNVTLNGIQIKILEELKNGSIKVRIRFNETRVSQNRRWAGDDIILPHIKGKEGYSLIISKRKKIDINRSHSATKVNRPFIENSDTIFSNPTRFIVQPRARILLEKKSRINLKDHSKFILQHEAEIIFKRKSKIVIESGSELILPKKLNDPNILKYIEVQSGGTITFKDL